MIGTKRVLAMIPARGGSKGIPRKNIKSLAGKPLIAWTIEAARASRYIDRLILSSDDDEIMAVAREYGCEVPFVRPPELARDETAGIEPVLHAMTMLPGFDYLIMLQPTSPLRTSEDIDAIIELCHQHGAASAVSVTEADHSPYWMYRTDTEGRLQPLLDQADRPARRQDLPDIYILNGALYIATCQELYTSRTFVNNRTVAYIMPRERSLDIDTPLDLTLCELLLQKH